MGGGEYNAIAGTHATIAGGYGTYASGYNSCIGGHAPVYIAQEIMNDQFQIVGGRPGLKVSWEVQAVRNDPWVRQQGAPEEIVKPADNQGTYLHPELYGLPQTFAEMRLSLEAMEPVEAPSAPQLPLPQIPKFQR